MSHASRPQQQQKNRRKKSNTRQRGRCYFFHHGGCQDGDNCKFLHEIDEHELKNSQHNHKVSSVDTAMIRNTSAIEEQQQNGLFCPPPPPQDYTLPSSSGNINSSNNLTVEQCGLSMPNCRINSHASSSSFAEDKAKDNHSDRRHKEYSGTKMSQDSTTTATAKTVKKKKNDKKDSISKLSRSKKPCRFFLKGNCKNGKHCNFSHENMSQEKQLPNHDRNKKDPLVSSGGRDTSDNNDTPTPINHINPFEEEECIQAINDSTSNSFQANSDTVKLRKKKKKKTKKKQDIDCKFGLSCHNLPHCLFRHPQHIEHDGGGNRTPVTAQTFKQSKTVLESNCCEKDILKTERRELNQNPNKSISNSYILSSGQQQQQHEKSLDAMDEDQKKRTGNQQTQVCNNTIKHNNTSHSGKPQKPQSQPNKNNQYYYNNLEGMGFTKSQIDAAVQALRNDQQQQVPTEDLVQYILQHEAITTTSEQHPEDQSTSVMNTLKSMGFTMKQIEIAMEARGKDTNADELVQYMVLHTSNTIASDSSTSSDEDDNLGLDSKDAWLACKSMGFTKKQVRKAVKARGKGASADELVQWVLLHGSDIQSDGEGLGKSDGENAGGEKHKQRKQENKFSKSEKKKKKETNHEMSEEMVHQDNAAASKRKDKEHNPARFPAKRPQTPPPHSPTNKPTVVDETITKNLQSMGFSMEQIITASITCRKENASMEDVMGRIFHLKQQQARGIAPFHPNANNDIPSDNEAISKEDKVQNESPMNPNKSRRRRRKNKLSSVTTNPPSPPVLQITQPQLQPSIAHLDKFAKISLLRSAISKWQSHTENQRKIQHEFDRRSKLQEQKIKAQQKKQLEKKYKLEQRKQKAAEEKKKLEKQQLLAAAEEEKRIVDEQRIAEEQQRIAEEQQRIEKEDERKRFLELEKQAEAEQRRTIKMRKKQEAEELKQQKCRSQYWQKDLLHQEEYTNCILQLSLHEVLRKYNNSNSANKMTLGKFIKQSVVIEKLSTASTQMYQTLFANKYTTRYHVTTCCNPQNDDFQPFTNQKGYIQSYNPNTHTYLVKLNNHSYQNISPNYLQSNNPRGKICKHAKKKCPFKVNNVYRDHHLDMVICVHDLEYMKLAPDLNQYFKNWTKTRNEQELKEQNNLKQQQEKMEEQKRYERQRERRQQESREERGRTQWQRRMWGQGSGTRGRDRGEPRFFFRFGDGGIFFELDDSDGDEHDYHHYFGQEEEEEYPEDQIQKRADILGVEPDATTQQIKTAFRKKALKYHPDKFRPDDNKGGMSKEDAEEHFKNMNEAQEYLLGMKEHFS